MVKQPLAKSWSFEHNERQDYIVAQDESFSQQEFTHDATVNPTTAATTIYNTIVTRLQARNLDVSRISPPSVNFITRCLDDSMLAILNIQMEVSDETLMQVLQLRQSTEEDIREAVDPELNGTEYFYVRSYAFTVEDIHTLVKAMAEEEDYRPEEQYHWLGPFVLLREAERANRMCYIRYVGRCAHPSVPYTRMIADIKQRTSGLLAHFLSVLERKFMPPAELLPFPSRY